MKGAEKALKPQRKTAGTTKARLQHTANRGPRNVFEYVYKGRRDLVIRIPTMHGIGFAISAQRYLRVG
jgi:hypothetical protein